MHSLLWFHIRDIRRRCNPITHTQCPAIPAEPGRPGDKPCCVGVGTCLGSAEGCRLFTFRNRFLRQMKRDLASVELKLDVAERKVFACLECSDPQYIADPIQAEFAALAGRPRGRPPELHWFLLGAHSWTPYRSVFKLFLPATTTNQQIAPTETLLQA